MDFILLMAMEVVSREHCQIAGNSLEPLLPSLGMETYVAEHQGNDLGYGKNAKDWTIRSQVLRAESLWMQFND